MKRTLLLVLALACIAGLLGAAPAEARRRLMQDTAPTQQLSCAQHLAVASPGTSSKFIDPDTPPSECSRPMCRASFSSCATVGGVVTGPKDDMVLVFSDEFESTSQRNFSAGCDSKWQALDLHYLVNGDQAIYKPEAITLANGSAVITVTREVTTGPVSATFGEANFTLPYKSGMMQTWNKFCYTGGYLEARIKLPGEVNHTGLWPAVWMMGNLGRAGYVRSTEGMWPYSYNVCDQAANGSIPWSAQRGMRINACNSTKARSATEIDLLEVGIWHPGKPLLSSSLQIAPLSPPNTIWLDHPGGMFFPTAPDAAPNSTFMTRPNDWAGLNSYTNTPRPGTELQDAISAVHELDLSWYTDFHLFGVDWMPGEYIRWYLDGYMVFELNSVALKGLTNAQNQSIGDRVVPYEPSYIIMNVALSDTFTLIDPDLPLPASMEVDYVRVWQYKDSINIGCDPPDYPTRDYIACHLDLYMLQSVPDYVDLAALGNCSTGQSPAVQQLLSRTSLQGVCTASPPPPSPPSPLPLQPPPSPSPSPSPPATNTATVQSLSSPASAGVASDAGAGAGSPQSAIAQQGGPGAEESSSAFSGTVLYAVIGVAVGVPLVALAAWLWYRRRSRSRSVHPDGSPLVKPAAPIGAAPPPTQDFLHGIQPIKPKLSGAPVAADEPVTPVVRKADAVALFQSPLRRRTAAGAIAPEDYAARGAQAPHDARPQPQLQPTRRFKVPQMALSGALEQPQQQGLPGAVQPQEGLQGLPAPAAQQVFMEVDDGSNICLLCSTAEAPVRIPAGAQAAHVHQCHPGLLHAFAPMAGSPAALPHTTDGAMFGPSMQPGPAMLRSRYDDSDALFAPGPSSAPRRQQGPHGASVPQPGSTPESAMARQPDAKKRRVGPGLGVHPEEEEEEDLNSMFGPSTGLRARQSSNYHSSDEEEEESGGKEDKKGSGGDKPPRTWGFSEAPSFP